MLQRLVEAHYLSHRAAPTPEQTQFWLRELRTPELLVEAAHVWPQTARALGAKRPLLTLAQPDKLGKLEEALAAEEGAERAQDRLYWQPLKAELEQLRRAARKQ